METLSIVMPAYNEEKRIGNTLKEYINYFELLKRSRSLNYEIIIVINNTKDRTEEIAKKYQSKEIPLKILNFKQGGKGFAVTEGFKEAIKSQSKFIGFVDADLATSPKEFHKLIDSIKNFDGAIADRYLPSSKVYPPATFRRLVVSRIFNFVIRSLMFLPYKDTQCGAKVFRREALQSVIYEMTLSQWAFDVELLYCLRRRGFDIIPIPTTWVDKEYSKINFWRAGPWMFLGIIRLRILYSPFKGFIRIYDKLIGFIPK